MLEALVRDFMDKVKIPNDKTVELITAKARRSRFLPEDDRARLETIAERHLRFMANAETMLQSACDAGIAMDRAVVQRCHEHWKEANGVVTRIEDIVRNFSAVKRKSSPMRPPRAAPPLPRALRDVESPMRRRSVPRLGTPTSTGRSGIVAQSAELAGFEKKKFISPDEAKEAQLIFVRLLGPADGKREFLSWLAQLPMEALRSLQQQMPQHHR